LDAERKLQGDLTIVKNFIKQYPYFIPDFAAIFRTFVSNLKFNKSN